MSEACFTARATLRTQVGDLINELPLNRNESGQYNHDDITVFIKGVERHFKGLYNPLQPGQGLTQLLAQGQNALTKLKSTDMYDAASVLKQSARDAAALARQSGIARNLKSLRGPTPKTKPTAATTPSKPPSGQKREQPRPSQTKSAQTSPIRSSGTPTATTIKASMSTLSTKSYRPLSRAPFARP